MEATASTRPLIQTKLQAPVPRELVERPSLLDALAREPRRLTLVSAPAGWGKSSLLAAWSRWPAERRRFVWLALEPDDDEPVRFWGYVVEALRRVDTDVGSGSLLLLNAPGTRVIDDVMPVLTNEVAELSEPVVLVLDDYHLIQNPEIHEQLGVFVDHLPAGLQLAVGTRTSPPLPLGRLRVQREVHEVGAAELRFDEDETEAFLNHLLGLGLGHGQLEQLRERTEGWAAGLYLAALSIRSAGVDGDFVERFAGDDRHIVDYLGSEVLAAQSGSSRDFLLRTSILDRFCAPLCNAVADTTQAASLLAEIESANLFLVPLDSTRTWYRYHHLFQELLRLELSLVSAPEVAELHRRAAAWFLSEQMVSEAILHTVAAGEVTEAGELIAANWAVTLLGSAGDHTVHRWLSELPERVVRSDLRLCFAAAFIALSLGRMDDVRTWLRAGEEAPLPGPFLEGLTSREGAIACVECAYLWESGDAGGSFAAAGAVLEAEPEGAPWRAIGVACLGLGHIARGEWDEGRHWTGEYARIGRESGHHLNHASGLASMSACLAELGNFRQAEQVAAESISIADRHGISEHWCMAHAHLSLGLVREANDDLDSAGAELDRAAELVRRGYGPTSTAWILAHLARVAAARGDNEGTTAALSEARAAVEGAADVGIFAGRVDDLERRLGVVAHVPVALGDPLTKRELEVLRLLPTRMSQREIGAELYVSLNTVKTHTRSIFRKLGASTREDAVARARQSGLI
jgi:ATP/maltotriose-dependent transcriptional regulator MalT